MIRVLFIIYIFTSVANAQEGLTLPENAVSTSDIAVELTTYQFPNHGYAPDSSMTISVEGNLRTQTYRFDDKGFKTLALVRLLRGQIRVLGYSIILDCDQKTCGGFDFRFGFAVTAAPMMEVDLTDFRFISAKKFGPEGDFALTILVSKTPAAGYLQLAAITPPIFDTPAPPVPKPAAPENIVAGFPDVDATLGRDGHMVLDGLVFESGEGSLASDPTGILAQVAEWLSDNPDISLILVGHSDNEGSLESNQIVSQQRAASVRQQLIDQFAAEPSRLFAEGAGFLAPRATNATPEGRATNRRVEIVVR